MAKPTLNGITRAPSPLYPPARHILLAQCTQHNLDPQRWFYRPFFHGTPGLVTVLATVHPATMRLTSGTIHSLEMSQFVLKFSHFVGRALSRPPGRSSLRTSGPSILDLYGWNHYYGIIRLSSQKRAHHAFIPPSRIKTLHFESGGSASSLTLQVILHSV